MRYGSYQVHYLEDVWPERFGARGSGLLSMESYGVPAQDQGWFVSESCYRASSLIISLKPLRSSGTSWNYLIAPARGLAPDSR